MCALIWEIGSRGNQCSTKMTAHQSEVVLQHATLPQSYFPGVHHSLPQWHLSDQTAVQLATTLTTLTLKTQSALYKFPLFSFLLLHCLSIVLVSFGGICPHNVNCVLSVAIAWSIQITRKFVSIWEAAATLVVETLIVFSLKPITLSTLCTFFFCCPFC